MQLHNALQIYYHSEPLGDTASLILFRPHRLHTHTDCRGPAVKVNFITNSETLTHNCHFVPLLRCVSFPLFLPCFFTHLKKGAMPRAYTYDLYEKQLIRHINRVLQCSQGILMKTYTALCFFSSSLPD